MQLSGRRAVPAFPLPLPRLTVQASEVGFLALLIVLATALRFFRIDVQSLWFDEGISVFHLQRGYLEIAQATAGDTHPPLYYWALKVWTGLFGRSELALRSLSAVAGVGAVGLTWAIGRRVLGPGAAGFGALLLAVSPLAVYYSQEVRMYMAVLFLSLLAVYLALGWLHSPRGAWNPLLVGYTLAAAAALYTQYLGGFLLLALNIFALGWLGLDWLHQREAKTASFEAVSPPRRILTWLSAQLAVVLLFAPWLPVLIDQTLHRSLNTAPRTLSALLRETATSVTLGRDADASVIQPAVAAMLALAVAGLLLLVRRPRALVLLLLVTVIPLAAVLAMGLRNGLFEVRYLTLALPGLTLLAGITLARLSTLRPRALGSGVAALALAMIAVPTLGALGHSYYDSSTYRDDYRAAIAYIQEHLREGDAIVLNAGNQWEVFSYYYGGDAPVYRLPAHRPIDMEDTRRRLEDIRASHERAWVLLWASREGDPTGFIENWFARNAFQGHHAWYQTLQLQQFSFSRGGNHPEHPLEVHLDNGVRLLGYTLDSRQARPGDTLNLTLYWQAEARVTERFKVFTQVLDSERQVRAQRDNEPVGTLRPTTSWQPGEIIADNYGIVLPDTLPAGRYALEVGMYRPNDGARPKLVDSSGAFIGDYLVLTNVEVN